MAGPKNGIAQIVKLYHEAQQSNNLLVMFPYDIVPYVILVGGFNPSEKFESNWKTSPNSGEKQKYLKPPPSIYRYISYQYYRTN